MSAHARPIAPVISMRTNGEYVNAVEVQCCWCCSTHWHAWNNETDSFCYPPCQAGAAAYTVTVGARVRMEHMRTEFPTPDGVIGLVPLRLSFAFEVDGPEDVVGIVLDTALGRFCVWVPLPTAVGLAGRIVAIAEDADELRLEYLERSKASL